jgi:hypothetical protein
MAASGVASGSNRRRTRAVVNGQIELSTQLLVLFLLFVGLAMGTRKKESGGVPGLWLARSFFSFVFLGEEEEVGNAKSIWGQRTASHFE